MSAIVIEHVPVSDLPPAWQAKFEHSAGARVTVRIETEAREDAAPSEPFLTDDPAFGIWRDRDDIVDVETYARRLRAPRFNRNGSCNET